MINIFFNYYVFLFKYDLYLYVFIIYKIEGRYDIKMMNFDVILILYLIIV